MIESNPERLLQDLRHIRSIGAQGKGVVRIALSPKDMEARHWLTQRMNEAGLDAIVNGLGTVFGRSSRRGKAMLIGSHTDTQATGGWLDGTLGVIYGVEIARAAAEANKASHFAIDVASWIDEQGEFSAHLGSRAFCGENVDAIIREARNHPGQSLGDALAAAGVLGRPIVRFERDRHIAYLEPHIEQGGRLEASGHRIGDVTSIVGVRELKITFVGQQNHAGTTPMSIRRDAASALLSFASTLNADFESLTRGKETVWNIGRIEVRPGSVSVVPGLAELFLQFRSSEKRQLQALEQKVSDLVDKANRLGSVPVSLETIDQPVEPVVMDSHIEAHVATAAEAVAPGQWIRMPSGACHDAQIIAQRLPAGMLFIPSIGGISHDPLEDTSEEDIVLGCRVAAMATYKILTAQCA